MRATAYAGWFNIVLGFVLGIGGMAIGQAITGLILLLSLCGSGVFMVWLANGWGTPLGSSDELNKFGRPANATVLKVEDEQIRPDNVRTAKLTLRVTPVNESPYKTTRVLAIPPGVKPAVDHELTVKFDPQKRKNVVLL